MPPPNPGVPYVKAYIGGQEITKAQDRCLESFRYQWDKNGYAHAYFEMIDKDWTFLEGLISQHSREGVNFSYGWLGNEGNSQLWSPPHHMTLEYFKPEVYDRFAKISFDGIIQDPEVAKLGSNPITDYGKQVTVVIKEKSASDVMKKLFESLGFDTRLIDKTKEFAKIHNSVDSTLADYPAFMINSQSAIQVFLNEIRYWATTEDSGSGIVKEIDGVIHGSGNNGRGGFYLYFIDSNPPQVGMTIGKPQGEIKASFDFPVNHKGKRDVVSFTWDTPIRAVSTGGEGAERVFAVDKWAGVGYSLRTQYHKIIPAALGNLEIDIVIPDGINSAQKLNYCDGSRMASVNALRQFIESSHGIKMNQLPGMGKLVILGRPDLRLSDTIQINVWINRVRDNKPSMEVHHQSGVWIIEGYTDTIMGGQFTTTLEVRKTSGIELTPEVGSSVNLYNEGYFNIADSPKDGNLPLNTKNPNLMFTDSNTLANFG